MKRFALVSILTSLPLQCDASDWLLVGMSTAQTAVYVDAVSITRVGPMYFKAWLKWEYIQPQKTISYPQKDYLSMKELNYYKCADKTYGVVQQVAYSDKNGGGDSVLSTSGPVDGIQYTNIIPDTLGETILNTVCDWGAQFLENPTARPKKAK